MCAPATQLAPAALRCTCEATWLFPGEQQAQPARMGYACEKERAFGSAASSRRRGERSPPKWKRFRSKRAPESERARDPMSASRLANQSRARQNKVGAKRSTATKRKTRGGRAMAERAVVPPALSERDRAAAHSRGLRQPPRRLGPLCPMRAPAGERVVGAPTGLFRITDGP